MKKILSVILCLAMILCFAACAEKKAADQGNETVSPETNATDYATYDIGDYQIELPGTYELNDLVEVQAEPSCIAMLTDKEEQLPELWIYLDASTGASLEEHMNNQNEIWNYNTLNLYEKDGKILATTVFDEDWYGRALVNEGYYKLEGEDKVLWFDFAYDNTADAEAMHASIVEIATKLGF